MQTLYIYKTFDYRLTDRVRRIQIHLVSRRAGKVNCDYDNKSQGNQKSYSSALSKHLDRLEGKFLS